MSLLLLYPIINIWLRRNLPGPHSGRAGLELIIGTRRLRTLELDQIEFGMKT